jgi:hypothetical protein
MHWLEDYHAQIWDKQIEGDLEAGRLETLLAEVEEEYEAQALMETELDARMAELVDSLTGRPAGGSPCRPRTATAMTLHHPTGATGP